MQPEFIKEILDKNSDRILSKIPEAEVEVVKVAITALVNEIEDSQDPKIKQNLLNLKFGPSQNSILHLAAKFGHELQTARILRVAADEKNYINIQNHNLFTPLHFAAQNGHLALVQTLISEGADKNPQASAEYRKWIPIHYAAQYGHVEVVKALIKAGVDKEIKTSFGLTPLLVGAEFGRLEVVKFMLSIGADKNVQTIADNHKMTALHYTIIGNYKEVALELLNAKAEKDLETTFGLTPIEFAARSNSVDLVKILLSWGADKWDSALEIAQENKSLEAAEQIKKYQEIRNNFFNSKFLQDGFSDLVKIIKQFTKDNLDEMKITLSDGVTFNAYGILSLKHQVGIFRKTSQTLTEFLTSKEETDLNRALINLKVLIGK